MTDDDEGVPMGKQAVTRFVRVATHHHFVRRIEVHEDQNYRWWWALYDDARVVHGPYDTKHDAKDDAHAREPHAHVETIPWKLP